MANEDLSRLRIDKDTTPVQPKKRKTILYVLIALLVCVLLVVAYVTGLFTPAVEVEVANVSQIYPSQTFTLLNASGYVVADRKASVASKITGRLVSLFVEEGSHVKAGQIVAKLEGEDAIAARDQATANLNLAKTNLEQAKAELHEATLAYDRNKSLLKKELIAQAEYDTSDARYKKAVASVAGAEASIKANAAALQAAEVALEYTIIRAPFDAVVLTKNADIGDIITPLGAAANAKAAVVTIADMGTLQVEADVSESSLELVKQGQHCEIQLDAIAEKRFRGVVHMIVPTADRSKATVMVKVRFVDKDIRILPEMSAKVAFLSRPIKEGEDKSRLALNPSAIINKNAKHYVFLVKANRAAETEIVPGQRMGDMVEVLNGVKAGDRIVVKPIDQVKNGGRIKIAEK